MQEELTAVVNDRTYLLKRIYHSELPLTYHVHFEHNGRPVVFRIRLESSDWKVLPHQLPDYVREDASGLIGAIKENETAK